MIPNFFVFGKESSPYMLFSLVGVLVTLFVTYRTALKRGIDELTILVTMLFCFGGGVIGAHLLYGALNYKLLFVLCKNLDKVTSLGSLLKALQALRC